MIAYPVDAWIRMVATTRLAGHSGGFFSARGKPPNQAVSVASQRRLNLERHQVPPQRFVALLVLRKTFSLLEGLGPEERETLRQTAAKARLLTASCDDTSALPSGSVALVVTAPPSPDARDFRADHWLRCWFHGVDPVQVPFPDLRNPLVWGERMKGALGEVHRVLRRGGRLALVVPEVRRVRTDLLAPSAAAGMSAGLAPELVLVHVRNFAPGISSGEGKGSTGTRILVFRRE